MHIDAYEFGRIIIDGVAYSQDVIIHADHVQSSWWRREGHCLHAQDIADLIRKPPEVLVIGQGFAGCMHVPDELVQALEMKGMEVHVSNTRQAVDEYNRLTSSGKQVVAALHLTC